MGSVCTTSDGDESNVNVKNTRSSKGVRNDHKGKGAAIPTQAEPAKKTHFGDNKGKEVWKKLGKYSFGDDFDIDAYETRSLPNGDKYKGEWDDDTELPHGRGMMKYASGTIYEGEWDQGKKSSHGRIIHAQGDIYEGEWENDRAHGEGKFETAGGQKYDGEWKNDEKHGHGVETWPDGTRYEGQYKKVNFVGRYDLEAIRFKSILVSITEFSIFSKYN